MSHGLDSSILSSVRFRDVSTLNDSSFYAGPAPEEVSFSEKNSETSGDYDWEESETSVSFGVISDSSGDERVNFGPEGERIFVPKERKDHCHRFSGTKRRRGDGELEYSISATI